jgi:hypothetical protein
VEDLVAQVTITGPDRLVPVFRIHQPHNYNGGRTRPTSGNGPEWSGSHND